MGARTSRRALGLVLATLVWLVPSRALAQSETTEYYGLDTTGSVRVVFDAAGSVLTRVDYGPFGEQLAAAPGAPNDKYAGLFRDDETGLDYAQARHYNPRTGRFTSLDPVYAGLFEPQRWNRYAYALNSPLVFSDPSGAVTQTVNCGLGAYWCPGAIQSGKDGDKYFDSYHYGYQGGEEGARAEAAYAARVDSVFADAVSSRLPQSQTNGQHGAAVGTITVIQLPDGKKVKPGEEVSPFIRLASDIRERTEKLTNPRPYAELFLLSSAGGVTGVVCAAKCLAALELFQNAAIWLEVRAPGAIQSVTDFASSRMPGPYPWTPSLGTAFAVGWDVGYEAGQRARKVANRAP